ncbi:MAG TPA: hypothetical protein VF172_02135 [Nitrososphaera sp.]
MSDLTWLATKLAVLIAGTILDANPDKIEECRAFVTSDPVNLQFFSDIPSSTVTIS